MPLPAMIAPVLSVLGWIGIDMGISWLTREGTSVDYVAGTDALTFLELHWPGLLLLTAIAIVGIRIAVPGIERDDGRGPRH